MPAGSTLRIFKSKEFARFARKSAIQDLALCQVAWELQSGLIHANLGGGVYKQRIARAGEGKSGSYRCIVFLRERERLLFVGAFAKNVRENIDHRELCALKEFAKEFFNYDSSRIEALIKAGALFEVFCD
jgi:hypothetical protein